MYKTNHKHSCTLSKKKKKHININNKKLFAENGQLLLTNNAPTDGDRIPKLCHMSPAAVPLSEMEWWRIWYVQPQFLYHTNRPKAYLWLCALKNKDKVFPL